MTESKVINQHHDNEEEQFPIVDEQGNILGAISRGHAHDGCKILHPVVHLHVFNSRGRTLPAASSCPEGHPARQMGHGMWRTCRPGESVEIALRREVREELGMTDYEPVSMGHYVFESLKEKELVYVHRCVYDGPVCPDKDELAGGRFWSKEEISENIGKNIFTPNFENEYKRFFLNQKEH